MTCERTPSPSPTDLSSLRDPGITYGLRGLSYFQVDVQGPASTSTPGASAGGGEPGSVLADMLARLKRPDGTVAILAFTTTS